MNYLWHLEYLDIPKILKNERKRRSLSYEDVGRAIGCSASHVYRVEKGERKEPSYKFVFKMISAFHIDDLSIYMDLPDTIEEEMKMELVLLKFIKHMNRDSVEQVNKLIQMIDKYRLLPIK